MKNNKFYQVFHRGHGVGFFLKKSEAQKYANEFFTEIEGYSYPVEIREMEFLDEDLNDKQESEPDIDWWDTHDTTSENGGV